MRPADMNELDESRQWHELYGGDSDDGGGTEGPNGSMTYEQQQVARRKKAPVRSRRRPAQGSGGAGEDVGMNGAAEAGSL